MRLEENSGLDEGTKKEMQILWRTKVPSKIKVFGWRIFLIRLPIRDELMKKGQTIMCMTGYVYCVLMRKKVYPTYYSNVLFIS